MNISSEIFPTDGSNFSDYFIYNSTEVETGFAKIAVDIIIILLGFSINSYVIWLILTGTGNGLAAEFFSLNFSACEMFFCMESLVKLINNKDKNYCIAAFFFYSVGITGRPLFLCLIYVERYLAVVHPVTFLKYKPLRCRLICSVIAWVNSFVSGGISIMTVFLFPLEFYYIFIMAHFSLFFSILLFCLVAVLRALKQSGPGERRRERNEENHMKRRAFLIILVTTVTKLIVLFSHIILSTLSDLVHNGKMLKYIGSFCFILAGLVHPLLFLYRMGKLASIKCQ